MPKVNFVVPLSCVNGLFVSFLTQIEKVRYRRYNALTHNLTMFSTLISEIIYVIARVTLLVI